MNRRRRKASPLVMLAAMIALAISAWMQRGAEPPPASATTTQVTATNATTTQAVPAAPEQTPVRNEPAAVAKQQAQAAPEQPQASGDQAQIDATLRLIERGGPFPHRQDGSVFQNRERRLPEKPRGYYREYTVPTPGASNRGARRIVRGADGDTWYTRDHYRTFVRIDE